MTTIKIYYLETDSSKDLLAFFAQHINNINNKGYQVSINKIKYIKNYNIDQTPAAIVNGRKIYGLTGIKGFITNLINPKPVVVPAYAQKQMPEPDDGEDDSFDKEHKKKLEEFTKRRTSYASNPSTPRKSTPVVSTVAAETNAQETNGDVILEQYYADVIKSRTY
jgi:hypothetical protein